MLHNIVQWGTDWQHQILPRFVHASLPQKLRGTPEHSPNDHCLVRLQHVAAWNSQGIHSHRTLSHCWIQIFRSVQAMTSLSAPMFFTEDPEVIWILRINVTTCENFAGQVSSAFKHSLRPIQFPLKISKNLKNMIPKYSKQIRLRKRSQRVWQYCTIPYPFSCGGARSQPLLGWCCSLAAYVLRIFANLALRSWPVSIQNYRKDQGPIRVNKKMKMHFSSIMKWTRVKLTAFKNQDRLKTTNVLCEWYQ